MGQPAARMGDVTCHGGAIVSGTPTTLIEKRPAARVLDFQVCPMVTVLVPHVGGPIALGAFNVLVGGMPQARMGDLTICVGPPGTIVLGSFTTLVGMSGAFSGGLAGLLGLLLGRATARSGGSSVPYPHTVTRPDGTTATAYSPGITIEGSPEYQAQVMRDLSSPRNRAWVDAIDQEHHHLVIRPIRPGQDHNNAWTTARSWDAFVRDDGSQGRGANSVIGYNPTHSFDYRAEDGTIQHMPAEDELGHELGHHLHNARGENRALIPDTQPGGDNQEEARNIGVHGYEGEPLSERTASQQAGRSPRPNHNSVTSTEYQDTDGNWYRTSRNSGGGWTRTQIPPANDRPME